jgi:EAL domain-containing protein (putative c-di-GMP-specific phosphodiesterase class I)
LGRHLVGSKVTSLGPFFEIESQDRVLNDLRRDVDRAIRLEALRAFAKQEDESVRLFINVTPRLMLRHLDENPHGLPWTIETLDQIGIDPRRIVIELTEEAAGAETESLRRLVDVYREHGCGIALDDVGADSSNLDRIGLFEPEIIKVDGAMLRRSLREKSFRHVLQGVGAMAEGLGAWLLFEGVETEEELQQALGFGARYVQGWYFAKAGPSFLPADTFTARLREPLLRFGENEVGKADAVAGRVRATLERLGPVPAVVADADAARLDLGDLKRWDGVACRVFVTDRHGFQLSPNYVSANDGWIEDAGSMGRYRAVRPYFPGPDHPPWGSSWSVSTVYFDVNDQRPMRTFGHRTADGLFVFVDVLEIEKPH